jgi:hypothetical protein
VGSRASVLVVVVFAGAVSVSCFGGSSHPAFVSTPAVAAYPLVVTCDQIILRPKSPFAGGYRSVLGVISVPPAYIPQVVHTPGGRWPYGEKAGLVVRANRLPVLVSVPPEWRTRAAISWGNGKPAVSSLKIAACPAPPDTWDAYAGGFALRTRGACVPLVFQVGQRRALIRFGIGRRCD